MPTEVTPDQKKSLPKKMAIIGATAFFGGPRVAASTGQVLFAFKRSLTNLEKENNLTFNPALLTVILAITAICIFWARFASRIPRLQEDIEKIIAPKKNKSAPIEEEAKQELTLSKTRIGSAARACTNFFNIASTISSIPLAFFGIETLMRYAKISLPIWAMYMVGIITAASTGAVHITFTVVGGSKAMNKILDQLSKKGVWALLKGILVGSLGTLSIAAGSYFLMMSLLEEHFKKDLSISAIKAISFIAFTISLGSTLLSRGLETFIFFNPKTLQEHKESFGQLWPKLNRLNKFYTILRIMASAGEAVAYLGSQYAGCTETLDHLLNARTQKSETYKGISQALSITAALSSLFMHFLFGVKKSITNPMKKNQATRADQETPLLSP